MTCRHNHRPKESCPRCRRHREALARVGLDPDDDPKPAAPHLSPAYVHIKRIKPPEDMEVPMK